MFANGDWEHALVIFHRVKRQTNGANNKAERGIQRCLEAINQSLDQIKQSKVFVLSLFFTYAAWYVDELFSIQRLHILEKRNKTKKPRENQLLTQIYSWMISNICRFRDFDQTPKYTKSLKELKGTLSVQAETHVCNLQKQFSKDINTLTQEAIDYINTIWFTWHMENIGKGKICFP